MAVASLEGKIRSHAFIVLVFTFGLYAGMLGLSVKVWTGESVRWPTVGTVVGCTWIYGILVSWGLCRVGRVLTHTKVENGSRRAGGRAALEGIIFFGGALLVLLPGRVLLTAGIRFSCENCVALNWRHVIIAGVISAYWPLRRILRP